MAFSYWGNPTGRCPFMTLTLITIRHSQFVVSKILELGSILRGAPLTRRHITPTQISLTSSHHLSPCVTSPHSSFTLLSLLTPLAPPAPHSWALQSQIIIKMTTPVARVSLCTSCIRHSSAALWNPAAAILCSFAGKKNNSNLNKCELSHLHHDANCVKYSSKFSAPECLELPFSFIQLHTTGIQKWPTKAVRTSTG